jgi:hypothetical protein
MLIVGAWQIKYYKRIIYVQYPAMVKKTTNAVEVKKIKDKQVSITAALLIFLGQIK